MSYHSPETAVSNSPSSVPSRPMVPIAANASATMSEAERVVVSQTMARA